MDNLFRDRFPLVFEGEKCPETLRVSMDFTSNGFDIVPSFEANPVFYVLSQFAKLFHLGRSFRFLNALMRYVRVRDCCECFVFKYTHALTVQ